MRELLATPAVAAFLGALVGMSLVTPLLFASKLARAGKTDAALYTTIGGSMGGLLVGGVILFGFRALTTESAFVWFGSAVIVGFVVGLGMAALLLLRSLARSGDETRS